MCQGVTGVRRTMEKKPLSIKVYLVHGTWARQARWMREGSPLRQALQDGLESTGTVTFATMPWTGRNNLMARARGSIELKGLLERTINDSDANFIIAHSHGGNIAADWAYIDTFEEGSEGEKRVDGVVTLNTPFFTLLPR